MNNYAEFTDLFAEQDIKNDTQIQREFLQHKNQALHDLMSSKSGRIFLRDFLSFCNVFADPGYKNSEYLQFNEGLRRAGMYVFSALVSVDATYITKIFKEEE